MNTTTVTTKGQATIPEEIRELLNIQVGDRVIFKDPNPKKKQVVIEVISKENIIDELYGSLKTPVPYIDMKTARKRTGILLGKKYKLTK